MMLRDGLTAEEAARFSADGYLLLGRFVDDEQLAILHGIYDQAMARGLGDRFLGKGSDGTTLSLTQVPKPEDLFPELWQTSFFTQSRRLASQLLETPEDDLNGSSHLIDKQARIGRDTPWHQDDASWLAPEFQTHEPRAVTFWFALDDATTTSGCLSFIPGSHVRTARHVFADGETAFVTVADPATESARQCPMRAGEASVHHCRTVHYAGPNTSARQRRAWALEFQAAPVPRSEPDMRTWLPEMRERMARRAQLGVI